MRSLDATLLTAIDAGNYDPYFLVTIQDKYTLNNYVQAQPIGYKLSDLEFEVTVRMPAFLDVPTYRTSVYLERGVSIAGSHYVLKTSNFSIITSTWDGNFQTFYCHLIPKSHYVGPANQNYQGAISIFCSTFNKTAVFLDAAAAWLNYSFLPTNKQVVLNNAQAFFALLRQKYFIFACDNGNDQILFYAGFSHYASAYQYTVKGYHFALDYNVDQKRQYLWRDEYSIYHSTSPTFAQLSQPVGTDTDLIAFIDLGDGRVLSGQAQSGNIMRSTDYGVTWTQVYQNGVSVYGFASPAAGVVVACGGNGGWIARSVDYGVTWTVLTATGNDSNMNVVDCGGGVMLLSHNKASSSGTEIYKSTDYGLTWVLKQSFADTLITSLAYLGGGYAVFGTYNTGLVYRSTDYGNTWSSVGQLGSEAGVYCLINLGAGQALAGTRGSGKIYKSINYGSTWSQQYDSPETFIYCLATLGNGVVLAGSYPTGYIYRSLDYGVTWSLIGQMGSETAIRSMLALGNGSLLAGTSPHAYVYRSLNAGADLEAVHNLGFMPSTAAEPGAYFQPAMPKFDPFPVHLKYQSSDFIRILLAQGGFYDLPCAEVVEILDLTKKSMPWRLDISQVEWLTNVAGGSLPASVEKSGAYIPLVNTNPGINNLQSLAELVSNNREVLTAGRNYYVRTDGNDANNGLTNSSSGAFLTIQHALDVVAALDLSIYPVYINVADGTYTGSMVVSAPFVGSGGVSIVGNVTTPANVVINPAGICLHVSYGGVLYVAGLKFSGGSSSVGLYADTGGVIYVSGKIDFGACSFVHIYACVGGLVTCPVSYNISGGAGAHYDADTSGLIKFSGGIVTVSGTPVFSAAFACATNLGSVNAISMTYSGSATGARYSATCNGDIFVNGGGTNYFPGNSAGSTATGGQYN